MTCDHEDIEFLGYRFTAADEMPVQGYRCRGCGNTLILDGEGNFIRVKPPADAVPLDKATE